MKKEFFKFVFLGAGSSVFTMRLVGDILKEDTIKKGHIALVDLDEKLLRETEEAVKELAREGFDPKYGARPLRRAIQSKVEDAVAEKMLDGTLDTGDTAKLTVEDGKLVVTK